MRGVRFTKNELETLQMIIGVAIEDEHEEGYPNNRTLKDLTSARSKLSKASEPVEVGCDAAALERALISRSMGKVVETTRGGYPRASRQATQCGATVDQMIIMGEWLARQKWRTEPTTIIEVLNKWPEWFPKAKATANPLGTREGLSGKSKARMPDSKRPEGFGTKKAQNKDNEASEDPPCPTESLPSPKKPTTKY